MSEFFSAAIAAFLMFTLMIICWTNADNEKSLARDRASKAFNVEFARCVNTTGHTAEGYAFCIEELSPALNEAINEGRQFE